MASSSDIRKLYKAFLDNPDFHAKVRGAKTPAEKHKIITDQGHTPVSQKDLESALSQSLQSSAPEDKEFVGSVLHLASGMSSDFA